MSDGAFDDPTSFEVAAISLADLTFGRPHPRLAGMILGYQGYDSDAVRPVRRRIVPVGAVAMIVDFLPTSRSSVQNKRELDFSPVSALQETSIEYVHEGREHGVMVFLSPIAAFSIFGVPMCELANVSVRLADLGGKRADYLTDRLAAAPSWRCRFAILDEVLSGWLSAGPRPSAALVYAWRRCTQTAGGVPIGVIAAEIGCTRRHLQQLAQQQIGLPLKSASRVLRFQRALRLLGGGARPVDIAAICGYTDQAHFSRDFRSLSGQTPTAVLATIRPAVGRSADRRGSPATRAVVR